MEYVLVCLTALAASGLTLFSGFGLGTILFPAFALFFPVDVAIAQTALVHLANNLFKLSLFWRSADLRTALRFGVPAMIAALAGAWLLELLADIPSLFTYQAWGRPRDVSVVKIALAGLMGFFAVAELKGSIKKGPAAGGLVAGGLLSGFFGGLSGHQGAFRSAYLLKAGLSKEAFIATGVVLACAVDVSRLTVYAGGMMRPEVTGESGLVASAALAAFAGAYFGKKLLKKMTIDGVRLAVAGMMIVVAAGLAAGLF
ncbi:MAG: sulfite exporter TauE/SafE family protein [Thermodesulfobacteriota bacterium]